MSGREGRVSCVCVCGDPLPEMIEVYYSFTVLN